MKGSQSQQKSFEQLTFMALYKLSKLRCSQLFLNPVSTELYPDYLSIITCPMDIQTIMNKFKSGNYSLISQIYEDLLLIGKNYFEYNKHEWRQQNNKTISRWIKSMDAGWNVLKKQLTQLGYKEDNKICNDRQVLEKIGAIEEKLKLAYIKKIEKIKDNGYQNIQQRKVNIREQQASQISTSNKITKINCVPKINNTAEIIQKIQVKKNNINPSPNQNSISNPSTRIGRLTRSKIIQNTSNCSIGINNQCGGSINNYDESRSKTRSGSRNSRSFSSNVSIERNTNGKKGKREKKLIKQFKELRKHQNLTNKKEHSHKSDSKIGWSQHEDIIEQTILINKSKEKKPEKKEEKEKEVYQIEQKAKEKTIQEQPQAQPELISILSQLVDEDKKQGKVVESQGQNTVTVGRQQTQTYHRISYTQTIQKVQSTFTITKSNQDEGESYERRSQPAEPAQHSKFDLQYHGQNSQTQKKQKLSKTNKPVQVANKISIRFQYEEPENNFKSKGTESNSQNDGAQQHSQANTDKVSQQKNNRKLIKLKLKKCKLILKNCIEWLYKHMINIHPSLTCPDVQHAQYLHKPSPEKQQICEQIEQCEQCTKYKKQKQLFKQLKSLKSFQHLQLSIQAQMYNLSKGEVKLKNILTLLKEMNLWVKFVIPGDGILNRNNRRFNKLYGWRLRDQYEQVQRNIIKYLYKIIQYKKLEPEFSLLLQQAIDEMNKQKQAAAHEKRYKNKNASNKKNYRRITRSCNKITKQLLSQPSNISDENYKIQYTKKNEQTQKFLNPQTSLINSQSEQKKVEDNQQFIKILAKDGVYKGFQVVINQEQCSKYQNIKTLSKNQKKKNKYSTNISNKQNRWSDQSFHSESEQENPKDILQNKSISKTKSKKKSVSFQSQSETENSSQEQDQFIPGTRTKKNKYARLKSLTKPQRQYLQHQHEQLNKKQEMQQDEFFISQYSLRSNVCVLQKYGSKLVFDWEAKKAAIFGELPSIISFQ